MARKKGKKNPGTMTITNPSKRKVGGSKKRGRRGMLGGITGALMKDTGDAVKVLGGRYAGELGSELGTKYLGETAGRFASTAGQVGLWFALKKVLKGATGRLVRLGLLSEAVDNMLAGFGVDIPGMVSGMLPGGAAVAPAPETQAGASGLGLLNTNRLNTRLAGIGNPYLSAYNTPY